jgi:hypothetical protein
MKALVIRIRDAGVFRDPRISGSQDKTMSINGKTTRFNKRDKTCVPFIKVSAGQLCYKHVANLLRVLWGERPVPTLRKVYNVFKGDPYFEDLAKKVRVNIESPIFPPDKGHKDSFYPDEATTVRKSVGDSWQVATRSYFLDGKYVQVKGGLLYPDRLRRYLGDDLYGQFNALVADFGFENSTQKSIELLNEHKTDVRVVTFCRACKVGGRTSLSNIILNEGSDSITMHTFSSKYPLNALMALQGRPEIIEKFNATLYVPVTEEDLSRINESTGIATFLEGGYAFIESCDEDWSELLELGKELTVEGDLCI